MDHTEQVIAESIDYLVAHYKARPDLDSLARRAGYETTYFQKLFREKTGISPKRLTQYMTMRHIRELLQDGGPLLDAAHGAGLSGGGRLHDLFVSCEAVTPGDVRHGGQGLNVIYGWHPSPLGLMLTARTERGVCYLGFAVDERKQDAEARMRRHLPHAAYRENAAANDETVARILSIWRGKEKENGGKLRLDLHGTNLQIQVWQALLRIPCGATATYGDIAAQLDRPKAARAVGNAVGANPVSLLIPCHRVIRATGIIDNYGWGSARKKLILGVELSK